MRTLSALALAACLAAPLAAQSPAGLEAKTIELKHLKPQEAANLLRPYLVNGAGSVSSVSMDMPIITIKDVASNIPKLEQVLAKYDHSPATIRLVFQLIEADTGPRMIATAGGGGVASDLDAALRSVLKFSGYRLMAQGMATSGEYSRLSQTLARADTVGTYTYDIQADVGTIRLSDATLQSQATPVRPASTTEATVDTMATGTVHLNVALVKRAAPVYKQNDQNVIVTGLDVPLGHTVVLGTAASMKTGVAIILTVKPELVRAK
jgi:hypothetical protein